MAAAAPTGCFKCGRPGHWSRDCPSSSSSTGANPNPNFSKPDAPFANSKFSNRPNSNPSKDASGTPVSTGSTSKKKFNARPKLTPDLLLSDDGLGYVLKHFPCSFKYHGRGHEATDLGNLIGLYAQWHSYLIPYYSFDQFIKKVEQVGATKRVRRCINELCERVARGGDPTKLHEPLVEEQPIQDSEPNDGDNDRSGDAVHDSVDPSMETPFGHDAQEDMFNEIYESTTTEPQSRFPNEINSGTMDEEAYNNNSVVKKAKIELSEEQWARMEANRLKALERAKARALASQSSEI